MQQFIDGEQVLERLQIRDFELIGYVTHGLEPYDRYGRPWVTRDIMLDFMSHFADMANHLKLLKESNTQGSAENRDLDIYLQERKLQFLSDLLKSIDENNLQKLADTLPVLDEAVQDKIISRIVSALYLSDQVASFAGEDNSKYEAQLDQINDLQNTEPTKQPLYIPQSRIDRVEVQKFARDTWLKEGDRPSEIVKMIDLVKQKLELNYSEKTIRGWINRLHPEYDSNRKGRRPKK